MSSHFLSVTAGDYDSQGDEVILSLATIECLFREWIDKNRKGDFVFLICALMRV